VILPFKVTKNITLLGTEFFNLYLVKGETYAIIEGGVSGITYTVLNQLNQMNILPEAISHLIILHSHFDHMMVFHVLKERYPWMKIVSSGVNQATFSSERIMAKIFESDRKMTLTLMERALILEAPTLHPQTSFPLDISVEEESIIDLGKGIKITFFNIPGHSPDCISAYDEEEGLLFCSDGAGFYRPPDFFRPNYWFSLDEAVKSLDKMKALDPEILCRGHYGTIVGKEGIRKHLHEAQRNIENFKAFVLEKIQSGCSVEEVTEIVMERFSGGSLELFPAEDKYRLWKLLIRRTLEHFGISTH
jgi:glyoxylase-like metal-dependent hydrolase (beta-lactamase superfamily II)